MKFLALLTPADRRTIDQFEPYFVDEERAVWAAYKVGRLREIYFQPNPQAVTAIFEADNAAEVHADLDRLPMVKAGLLDRHVVELGPWLPLEVIFDKKLMLAK